MDKMVEKPPVKRGQICGELMWIMWITLWKMGTSADLSGKISLKYRAFFSGLASLLAGEDSGWNSG